MEHYTKNHELIEVKGTTKSIYFTANRLNYLSKVKYNTPKANFSNTVDLGIRLIQEKYPNGKIPISELLDV